MMTEEVQAYFDTLGKKSAILYGIEAHVCIQQTALDLLDSGVDVHLVTDWCSSSDSHKRDTAIERMIQAGALPTTVESLAFEIMRACTHPEFKNILKHVVKDAPEDQFPGI